MFVVFFIGFLIVNCTLIKHIIPCSAFQDGDQADYSRYFLTQKGVVTKRLGNL